MFKMQRFLENNLEVNGLISLKMAYEYKLMLHMRTETNKYNLSITSRDSTTCLNIVVSKLSLFFEPIISN